MANSTKPPPTTPNCDLQSPSLVLQPYGQSVWPARQRSKHSAHHMLLYVNHHPSDHPARATEQQAAQEAASSWPSCVRGQLLYMYMCFGGVSSARCQLLNVSSRDLLLATTGYWLLVLPRCCGWHDFEHVCGCTACRDLQALVL